MICAICNGTGLMRVVRSAPNDLDGSTATRLCICGVIPAPAPTGHRGVAGNMPLEGRESILPDLSRYRLKARRARIKIKGAAADYGDAATAITIDFKTLHGIK